VTEALAAHIEAMTEAREHGDLRTVQGHAYPVSQAELARWQQQQKAARAEQVKRFLRTRFGRRLTAERAFS
jgi:hypothetical protein